MDAPKLEWSSENEGITFALIKACVDKSSMKFSVEYSLDNEMIFFDDVMKDKELSEILEDACKGYIAQWLFT